MIERIQITPDYNISRILKGGWHLAGGHGKIDEVDALDDMLKFVEAGITTFDCADIYTGVEEMIGNFLKVYKTDFVTGNLPNVQIHTKFVPDYNTLSTIIFEDVQRIIDRSLKRLGVERLDLVQFSWWDYKVPRYIEVAHYLKELQKEGKIRYIGLTNFDGKRVQEIVNSGIPVLTNQVQYSLLDHRVEKDSNRVMEENDIKYLCYGVIAGGFLSNRYLGSKDPTPPYENRSLTKYRLIIDEYGGYDIFQKALQAVARIAQKHNVGIAEVVSNYILKKKHVAGIIIGARNSEHLEKIKKIQGIQLDESDMKLLNAVSVNGLGPKGPFYALERDKNGKHGRIMKYNLNKE